MFQDVPTSVSIVKAKRTTSSYETIKNMIEFTIVCLLALALCEALPKPSDSNYEHFPHLKTVHHGHGATSYQNVNVQNFLSVPIPKDLQVDDGHEYEIQREYLENVDDKNHQDISSLDSHNFVDSDVNVEQVIVSGGTAEELDEDETLLNHESQDNYVPSSNYETYDHEIEYEYH